MNTLPSAALLTYFKDYEQYHQTKGNKFTHLFGIPFVMFSLFGLLSYVVLWSSEALPLFRLDLGVVLALVGILFSLRVDYKIGIPFSLYVVANYLIARHLAINVLVALQVIGWVFQLYGHYVYEKKSPAFFKSLHHTIVGPMWIFSWLCGYYKSGT